MTHKLRSFLSITFTALLLTSCGSTPLSYTLDPEIPQLDSLKPLAKLIAVSVNDQRDLQANTNSLKGKIIASSGNDAKQLRQQLINQLKNSQFQIIQNPLLADLSIEIQIEQFQVTVEEAFMSATIHAASHLRLVATKQGQSFEKVFKSKRSQEVASPVNKIEITGLVNQLLGAQLALMLEDQGLTDLAATAN